MKTSAPISRKQTGESIPSSNMALPMAHLGNPGRSWKILRLLGARRGLWARKYRRSFATHVVPLQKSAPLKHWAVFHP